MRTTGVMCTYNMLAYARIEDTYPRTTRTRARSLLNLALLGPGLLQVDLLCIIIIVLVLLFRIGYFTIDIAQEVLNRFWENLIGNRDADLFFPRIISLSFKLQEAQNNPPQRDRPHVRRS
jgi:hypothetical protein